MNATAKILLLAVAFTVACTRVETSGGSGSGTGHSWTHHGLLRIVNLQEPDTLDPEVGNAQIDADLSLLWGGEFFNFNDRNELVPELATVVPTLANGGISRDGHTITYHLRPGVLWHDGKPFTAADVVFTWHAIMNKSNNVGSTVGFDDIAAIDVRDPHTIVVHLKNVYAPFVATFFAPSSTMYPVLPEHVLAKYSDINRVPFNSQPIGTGPFVVDRWQRGSKIVFRANPHYWRGPPKLKEIWYTPVGDENTIATLLASHGADLEYRASPTNYAQIAHIDGFDTVVTPFTEYAQLAINTHSPVLGDVRVRRAMWSAFDSGAANRDIAHGVNVRAYADQPQFSPVYNPHVAHYDFDPAKARELLDAAGWKVGPDGIRVKDGKRLSIVIAGVSGSATGNAMNIFAQRAWRDVGIEADTKLYVASLFFASYGAGGIVQNDKFDVAFFSWTNGVDPDDSTQFMCDQKPPSGENVYLFCDPQTDAAEKTALTSYDPNVRKAAYRKIQERIADQVPAIYPWFTSRISVQNTDLKNYRPAKAVSAWWNPYQWEI